MGQKNTFFEKQSGEVAENKEKGYMNSQKRTGNEPENEAGKLLKTRGCGKNEPGNKAGHVIENKQCQKTIENQPEQIRDIQCGPASLCAGLWYLINPAPEGFQRNVLTNRTPNWMPNILQLYRRNSDLWQDLIAKFSDIRYGLRNGQPLPSPESLGLLPGQQSATQ